MTADTKPVTPAFFAHAVLKTGRFEEMVAHWKTLLNATVAFQNPMLCFMTFDEEHHRLAIAGLPGLQDIEDQAAGLDHLAYTYASADDLIATYDRLKSEGITPSWCINHGPTLSLYYKDPDGNRAELQIDLFSTPEETNAFLTSEGFAENPIGIKFDPEELFGRYKAGEPLKELTDRRRLKEGESFLEHLDL